jgi:hypothetical protein
VPNASQLYRVGISGVDITPPVGIRLSGFAARTEPCTGVYHPLSAVAVAIDDGATPILLLGADILGFYDKAERVRALVSQATGVPASHIVLNGSHTHCGPHLRDRDVPRFGPLDEDYLQRAFGAMASAASKAWRERAPARLRFGSGVCTFGTCRRRPDPDRPGRVLRTMLPYPEGPHDHEAPVIAVETPGGALRGVIFSYAAHPTSRGGLEIGPDYVGYARDRIESLHPDATACFLQGCGADQKPRPPVPDATGFGSRTVGQVEEIGVELGDAASAVIRQGALTPVTGPIAVHQLRMTLRTEPVDPAEVETALHGDDPYMADWARGMRAVLDRGGEPDRDVPFEAQAIAVGSSLAVVTLAAEATVEHGLRFKRELRPRFGHVLVLGYANGVIGYIPVKRQIPEGGYEVDWANRFHGRPGAFVAGTEDRIHEAVQKALA